MKCSLYVTNTEGMRIAPLGDSRMQYINTDVIEGQDKRADVEQNLVNIHKDVEYQTFGGIGGAFSDTSATVWSAMPEDKKEEFIRAYFDKNEGIGYTVGRLSIGSCDFSTGDYTYVDEGDETLDSFDISREKVAVIPMVRAAKKYSELKIFASPWSPPAYMKTSNNRIGGHLKKEYYSLWAKYFKKYIEEFKKENIDVWAVTMQNEPRHHQVWESCLYTPEEEAEFLGYLGKALEGSGVKILCYDHCRERVFERAKYIYGSKNGKYCDGIANHWYSGDHFGELRAHYTLYPDKISIASESCCAISGKGIHTELDLPFAERYAHDIIGCFNNGLHYYCDWNMLVDENNGPSHNRENRPCSVDAPIYYIKSQNKLLYRLSYYYIGHVSKFVRENAKVVATSSYSSAVEAVSFKNADGSLVSVMLNRGDVAKKVILRVDGHIKQFTLDGHSIVTAVITD